MTGLLRSEFRKLLTTQVWFWLLLASVAIAVISVVVPIASNDNLEVSHHVYDVLGAGNAAYISVFVLGVLGVTTEFRYQTITPTVLITPSRWALITAKLIAFAIVGLVYAVICAAIGLAIALPWLSARGIPLHFGSNGGAILAAMGAVALFALVGLGAGALMKNQIVAVTVGLLFLLLIDNLIVTIPGVKVIYPYLPTGLLNSMTTAPSADRYVNDVHLLPIWAGVFGLIVWGLGMAVLGAGLTMNRDIT
jgi:ABC-2 type transport system permease protein